MKEMVSNRSSKDLLGQAGAEGMASRLLMSCGLGRYLLVGDVDKRLLWALRANCVSVDVESTLVSASEPDYDVLVLFNTPVDREHLEALASHALARARRLVAVLTCGGAGLKPSREAIEQAFIDSGGRKHAAGFLLSPYDCLDASTSEMWWLFEPSPKALLEAYPLRALKDERDLHMDMTREAGRRSDAHLVRYFHASEFVRPGDRVMDAACGLGYGAYVIAGMTRASGVTGLDLSEYAKSYADCAFAENAPVSLKYLVGDAQDLSGFPDASVDFFVSVETLEHVTSPEQLLAEVHRVLTPGGRLYVSVPNDWSDETGEDPNPFHLHVYVWERLAAELMGAGFLIERAWLQTAGGGMKLTQSPRSIVEFDPVVGATEDGEWLLALAIKPPDQPAQRGKGKHAVEHVANIVAFERDYASPALVRAMVSIGLRATSADVLERFAKAALLRSSERSADRGAALCVLLYRLLQSEPAEVNLGAGVVGSAWDYVRLEHECPTGLRWRVSLAYALGLVALRQGKRDRAKEAFELAAGFDALEFSPLLGTKTVGASVLLGRMACADGDLTLAASLWRRALGEVRRILSSLEWSEVISDESSPETFGCPELALVVIEAGRAASGLRALSEGPRLGRQGLWFMTRTGLDDQLADMKVESRLLKEQMSRLERVWAAESQAAGASAEALNGAKGWLEGQLEAWRTEAARLQEMLDASETARANERDATHTVLAELNDGKRWLEGQLEAWRTEAARLQEMLDASETARADERAAVDVARAEFTDGKRWLEGQVEAWRAEAGRWKEMLEASEAARAAERASAEAVIAGLTDAKAWLEGQFKGWQAEAARLQSDLDEVIASGAVERHTAAEEYAKLALELSEAKSRYQALASSWWVRMGVRFKLLSSGGM